MEANQLRKQVLDFQKGAFSSWFGVMAGLQEQAALTVGTMLKQASWIPEEGRQAMLSWVSAWKNEGDRFKTYVEESFSGLEKCFVQTVKVAPAKSKEPVAKAKKAAPPEPKKPAAEESEAATVQETKKSAQ